MTFTKIELLGVGGALITVISTLWILLRAYLERESQRLEKYEELNERNQIQIVELTGEHRELKGRIDGIEALSESVLKEIRKIG